MSDIPPRAALTALTQAVDAVLPHSIIGFSRHLDDGQIQMVYSYRFGIGAFVSPTEEVPDALRPLFRGIGHHDGFTATSQKAIEWHLAFGGARRLVSVPVPDREPETRFWVGLSDLRRPIEDELRRLEQVGIDAARLLNQPITDVEQRSRLERLDLASGLLPALTQVLDIREVFDPLSEISKQALPHDMLTLGLFNDELTSLTMYARTGTGPDLGGTFPQPYPPAVVRAWDFDIIDDRVNHPLERDRAPTKLGNRSSIRVLLRLGDRAIGGLGFMSTERARYSTADVDIARRLADYVTVTLSHQRLAEQAKHNEALRARTDNLELLDSLLVSLIDTGNLRQVFERISAVVQKVLPHDAAWLPIVLPDGKHARIHAVVGVPMPEPDIVPIPEDLIGNSDVDDEIVEDLQSNTLPRNAGAIKLGYQSLLRVPVKLEGRFGGAVIFVSRQLAAYSPPDLLVARRIADRLALLISRDREVEASKRADEASARASKLEARVKMLTEELDARTGYRKVVGNSAEWRAVLTQATQVAPNETTVLLLGESGTGKEVVARFVHRASPRHGGPFVALNCAALPEQLLEAELFGYERGAYTGATQSKPGQLEQAAGGTLFLDEVGEMSLPAQAKFLRVLQEREFQRLGGTRVLRTDARVIAATNRDLERAIELNQFREDLYYRLNVFAIYLPALRERPDDVLPLSEAFLAEIGRGIGRPAAGISRDARARLTEYHWPGNVRELRNILERASILAEGGLITPEHLAIGLGARAAMARQRRDAGVAAVPPPPMAVAPPAVPVSSTNDLKILERDLIAQTLQRVHFNKSRAAKDLGLSRQQLYVRMKKYGLE
jgi:transcriptional regulator with GAF, ATPase, and Fis domain